MLKVFQDESALAQAAAKVLVLEFKKAATRSGKFSVVLSGGSTPEATYKLLSTKLFCEQIDLTKVHVFWGDERCVPTGDSRSNYRMANDALLSRVPHSPIKHSSHVPRPKCSGGRGGV